MRLNGNIFGLITCFALAAPCLAQSGAEAMQPGRSKLCQLFSDTTLFRCRRMELNTNGSEFGVTRYREGYVFASSRNNSSFGVRYYTDDPSAPLLDLFYFEKRDAGKFSKPKPFAGEINSKYNEGPATFSECKDLMICTRNLVLESDWGEPKVLLSLASSSLQGGKWSKPELLSFCDGASNYAHPALACNDSLLFFSSDRPGGYGGMDLYYSKLGPEGWSAPVNLGPRINSERQDAFPFCSPAGNLYFSSDREGGQGGLDIYAIDLSDTAAFDLAHPGAPLNSSADDFSFWCGQNELEGFFSSNRETKSPADDDIYFFSLDWPQPLALDTLKHPELCYTFFEEASTATKDTVGLRYEWSFSDGTRARGLEVKKCFDTTGVYHVELNIIDTTSGEVFENQVSFDFEIAHPNPIVLTLPDVLAENTPLLISTAEVTLSDYEVSSVFYDFGNGYKSRGAEAAHVYHSKGTYYPQVLFKLKNKQTGIEECRGVVKKIIVE